MSNKKSFMILRRLHGKLHESFLEKKKIYELIRRIKSVDKDTFFLLYTPTHGNLGDHAIAMAETRFMDKNKICYTEFNDREIYLLNKYNKLSVFNRRKILLHGGGYLGTLWPKAEMTIRAIIESCPKSNILLFPNTVYYEDNHQLSIEDSIRIYNSNPRLTVCTREKISYDLVANMYNNVKLVPDMVLSMNQIEGTYERNGCLVCLRNDIEKTMADGYRNQLVSTISRLFGENITYTDMVVDYRISKEDRENELNKKFSQFLKAKLVITDRLHGMIFSAITGTPCFVINSKSPKVKGCYEWIKNLGYIIFVENTNEIEHIYNRLQGRKYKYDNSHLTDYYDELVKSIKEMR